MSRNVISSVAFVVVLILALISISSVSSFQGALKITTSLPSLSCLQQLKSRNIRSVLYAADISSATTTTERTATDLPTEAQIIEAAKYFMENGTGYFNPYDPTLFAEDFIFRGPVIGPLNKVDYEQVLEYFSIYKAFPDINPNCFGYSIDPDNPLRVWFQLRASGTYTKPLGGPVGKIIKPNGTKYRGSTETWSLTFDRTLKARYLSAGYVSDRFEEQSTTDGIGLSFGILKTLGLSLPSGVGNPVLELIQAVNDPLVNLGISPKAMSKEEDVPSWWKSGKRGAGL